MYVNDMFEALDFTWTGDDGEIYRSLNGLVKNNNGIYKSSKQQGFIHRQYGWTLPSFLNPSGQTYGRFRDDAAMLSTNFGVTLQQGQRAIATSGIARWAPGPRGHRPVMWMFVLDNDGVVAKYKMKYAGDMRGGTHVDASKTVKEWERDPQAAAPAIQQLQQDAQQAQAAQAAAVASQPPSKHMGNVGDRLKGVDVEVTASFGPKPGAYGDYYINKLVTPAGEQLVYFGGRMNKGDKMTLAFTVKKHDTDQRTGQPTTIISRPKKVKTPAKATAPTSSPAAKAPADLPRNAAPPGTKVEKPLTTAELRDLLAKDAAKKEGFGDKEPDPDIVKSVQDEKKRQQDQAKKDEEEAEKNLQNYKAGKVRANWKKEGVGEDGAEAAWKRDTDWFKASAPKECPKCGYDKSFRNNSRAGGQSVRCARCGHEHAYKPYEKNPVGENVNIEIDEASPWQWRKGPGGTLTRTITPQDKAERERSLAAKRKEAYRKSAEGMMLEPLPDFDYDQFSKIVKGSMLFPQVENWEFDPRRDVRVNTPEGPVAGRQYLIMYSADLRKDMGYDDETINSMYGGQDTVEDSLQITIYRDPKNPKKFLVK